MNIARNAVEGTEIGRLLLRNPNLTLSHVLAETGTYPVFSLSTDHRAPAGTSPLLLKVRARRAAVQLGAGRGGRWCSRGVDAWDEQPTKAEALVLCMQVCACTCDARPAAASLSLPIVP